MNYIVVRNWRDDVTQAALCLVPQTHPSTKHDALQSVLTGLRLTD